MNLDMYIGDPSSGVAPVGCPGGNLEMQDSRPFKHMAMGQNPVPPVNIPIPTKIGSKLGGAYLPQNGTIGFDPQPY